MKIRAHKWAPALVAALLLCQAGDADAGSVFLKNGYILQGRIVERGDESVVLGWQNGKVTIHDRFIDEVLLDPAEEEMIRQQQILAEVAKEQEAKEVVLDKGLPLAGNEVLTLPDDFATILGPGRVPEFARGWSESSTTVESGGTALDSGGETPTDGARTSVEVVQPPRKIEKIFRSVGVVVDVPEGWRVQEREDGVRVVHEAAPQRDYFTVDFWRGNGITSEDAVEVLRDTLVAAVPGYTIEPGIDRSIAGKTAKTLACSAATDGASSRQQVVVTDRGVHVFGQFSADTTPPSVREELEALLNSVRLIGS